MKQKNKSCKIDGINMLIMIPGNYKPKSIPQEPVCPLSHQKLKGCDMTFLLKMTRYSREIPVKYETLRVYQKREIILVKRNKIRPLFEKYKRDLIQ